MTSRLTISEFARLVGLAPSALRFYDDCGLLPPASVDGSNGYRYYTPSQQPRARLLRDLREIDLPLAEVRLALDADPAELAVLVRAHLRTVEAKTAAARAAADHLLTHLTADHTRAVLGGPEFASAIRQVAPAAANPTTPPPTSPTPTSAEAASAPPAPPAGSASASSASTTTASAPEGAAGVLAALDCVLVEVGADEVVFVATDRYRLAVRTVRPVEFDGAAGRVLVRADELAGLSRWAAAGEVVELEIRGEGAVIVRDGESREIAVVDAEYPAYQGILDGLAPPVCRVVVDRAALRAALEGREVVAFDIGSGELRIDDGGPIEVIGTGAARIGFTASLLAAALDVSVGPDVLLEICAQDRPVVVRSADQGTFTTLVMPVRLDG
ncbi:MerR family transcriptional regulator [Kribbella capetownensis]|uniref:MerR family transcriptional regulator n=1 Tax=Kribbella capetownensis TaxID=1572659 RepID=A0A4R0K022_9ACTN|nr:MerR family transcriptional regulator [Kribbella capetownensis]TCC53221.1 MerR family transcriptional regulator [Kribbella capetownensis]